MSPESPALAGGFLTTEPVRKPWGCPFIIKIGQREYQEIPKCITWMPSVLFIAYIKAALPPLDNQNHWSGWWPLSLHVGFPGGSVGKESAYNVGDLSSISGLGRSLGEGKSYPLQYSGLENSMDYTAHRVTKSQTRLRDFHNKLWKQTESIGQNPAASKKVKCPNFWKVNFTTSIKLVQEYQIL